MNLPIETVEFTNAILNEFRKVFYANDRYIGFVFSNPELEIDFTNYLEKSLHEPIS